jgi:hypothetical protein
MDVGGAAMRDVESDFKEVTTGAGTTKEVGDWIGISNVVWVGVTVTVMVVVEVMGARVAGDGTARLVGLGVTELGCEATGGLITGAVVWAVQAATKTTARSVKIKVIFLVFIATVKNGTIFYKSDAYTML